MLGDILSDVERSESHPMYKRRICRRICLPLAREVSKQIQILNDKHDNHEKTAVTVFGFVLDEREV
jgi:hypothetical protein